MAVFDKASLVMIPSQYKEGKIYNIKPEDQSSSFEFERGSAATRVNSSGLIEQVGVGDIESVTNSDFNTTDNWVTGSTTSSFTVTNGIATIQGDANSFNTRIGQTLSLEANKSYFIKVRIKSNDGNYWRIRGYDNISGYFDITNGNNTEFNDITYVYNAPSGMNGAPILYISSNFQNGTTDFSVDFASVKEINTDTPRLDYSGTEPALLLEPQRTNIITYSSDTNNWGWGSDSNPNNTTRDFGYSAPDGSNNATLFTRNLGTSGFPAWGNIPTNVNTDFTYSIFVKKGTSDTIELFNVSTSPQSKVIYNFNTNTFTTELNATGKSVAYSDGWYRISMTYANGSATVSQIRNIFEDGKSVYLFGAQAEQGSYATSYIPTNGQTETRLADVCYGGGDASVFNDSEGTLYLELKYPELDYLSGFITISDGTTTDRIVLYMNQQGYKFYIQELGNIITDGSIDVSQYFKVAVKYKSGDNAMFINGSKVGTTNTSTLSSISGLDRIEFQNPDGAEKMKGNIKALHYFPEALTDTELQQLTTI